MKEKKIRLERDEFARALSVVERVVEAKDKALDPRFGNVLLDVDAAHSRLRIVAQNSWQAAISKTTGSSESNVKVALPGRLLIDYVKALPAGESVTLTAGGKGRKVTSLKMESGTHSCVLPAYPGVGRFEIPQMEEGDTSRAIVRGDLFRTIVRAAAGVSRHTEQSGPLAGIHVVAGESVMRFQGCDGLQVVIGYADLSDKRDGSADRTDATLPSTAVADLARHVAADEDVEVIIGEKSVAIICRAGEFYLQQVVGRYPDVERLIPAESAATAIVPNEEFRQSLKVVGVLVKQQKGTSPMRVTVEVDAIVLDYTGSEQSGEDALASGVARMAADTSMKKGSTHTVVDAGFITSHVAAMPSDVALSVELGGPGEPVTLRSSFGDESATARVVYVAAPMTVGGSAD